MTLQILTRAELEEKGTKAILNLYPQYVGEPAGHAEREQLIDEILEAQESMAQANGDDGWGAVEGDESVVSDDGFVDLPETPAPEVNTPKPPKSQAKKAKTPKEPKAPKEPKEPKATRVKKFSDDQIRAIRADYDGGMKVPELLVKYENPCSYAMMRNIVLGNVYKDVV